MTSSGGINATSDPVALLTPEWFNSGNNQLGAYMVATSPDCPRGDYEVRTYNLSDGTLSNSVAFYIAVVG